MYYLKYKFEFLEQGRRIKLSLNVVWIKLLLYSKLLAVSAVKVQSLLNAR